ncbi:impdh [Symbiodinium microadriaticum]|nr:impdh [Symbiodinium microadriaticum]
MLMRQYEQTLGRFLPSLWKGVATELQFFPEAPPSLGVARMGAIIHSPSRGSAVESIAFQAWFPSSSKRRLGSATAQGKGKGSKGSKGGGKDKGVGSEIAPTAPQMENVPAPPAAVVPATPKKTNEAGARLCRRNMVAEHQRSSAQSQAKSMHKAVAEQSKACAELQKLRANRAQYLAAWKGYIDQLSTLLEAQINEQGIFLEKFNAAEIDWISAEREATMYIARMATKDQGSSEADQDMEDGEFRASEAAEAEARLQKEKEDHLRAGVSLQEALQVARQQAEEHLARHQREGSRTPRRKAEVDGEEPQQRQGPGESVDLTKEPGGAAATPFKLGLEKPQPVAVVATNQLQPVRSVGGPASVLQIVDAPPAQAKAGCDPVPLDTNRSLLAAQSQPVHLLGCTASVPPLSEDLCEVPRCASSVVPPDEVPHGDASLSQPVHPVGSTALVPAASGVDFRTKGPSAHHTPVALTRGTTAQPACLLAEPSADQSFHNAQSQLVHPLGCTASVPPSTKDICEVPVCAPTVVPSDEVQHGGQVASRSATLRLRPTALYGKGCRLDLMSRVSRPEWSLLDYITAAVRSVPYRVRLVWYIVHPIQGLPSPQIVVTAQDAPAGSRALPVDLRELGGMLHTIELGPGPIRPVWEKLRDKGVDPGGRLEQAWLDDLCEFRDEQGQRVVDIPAEGTSPEWIVLSLTDPSAPVRILVDYVGGAGPVLRVPPPVPPPRGPSDTPASTSCTTTAVAVQPVAHHCQAVGPDETAVLPEDLAGPAERLICMGSVPGLRYLLRERVPLQRHYTLFERAGNLHIRPLRPDWSLQDLVQDVMLVVPMLRSIQVLHSPLDRLPILQVVATEMGWPADSMAVPFDLRGAGLQICTLVLGPGLTQRILHEAVWAECTAGRSGVPDTVPFADSLGRTGDTRRPLSDVQFFVPMYPAAWANDPAVTGLVVDGEHSPTSPLSADSAQRARPANGPVPQQLTLAQTRDNSAIMRDELTRHINARIHLMGYAGPDLYPVTVMGMHHGPVMLYLPGPEPSLEHVQIVLDSIPEMPTGVRAFPCDTFPGETSIFVTADPEAGTATAIVASTLGFGLDNLISVPLLPTQQHLGTAVYLAPGYGLNHLKGHRMVITYAGEECPPLRPRASKGDCEPPSQEHALARPQRRVVPPAPAASADSAPLAPGSKLPSVVIPAPGGRKRILLRQTTTPSVPRAPVKLALVDSIPTPPDDHLLHRCIRDLAEPWAHFWRGDLCSVPNSPACFGQALRCCVPALEVYQHLHLFSDGSLCRSPGSSCCGWGICAVFEGLVHGRKSFAFAGFAGGSLEPFLSMPLGAENTSYSAEVAAAAVATVWQLSVPKALPVTLWCDCQAVVGIIDGSMSPKQGQGCLSLASRLRSAVHLVAKAREQQCRVRWLPSHAGNPFNEFVDRVAKAGARCQIGDGRLAGAFWDLLRSPLLPWAWLAHGPDPALPEFRDLASGRYEARDTPPIECIPRPAPVAAGAIEARLALRICSCNVQTLRCKKPLVAQQLVDRRMVVAGLQETRMSHSSEINGAAFFEFFAAARNGEGGCALLFSRCTPYAWQGLRPLYFERSHFTCVHASPRCLAVRVKAPLLDVLVLSVHAPQSGQGLQAVTDWWNDFTEASWLRPHRGKVIACMDANAQLGSVESMHVGRHAGATETPAGSLLQEWLATTLAYLPATFFDRQGRCVPSASEPTWFFPSGNGYRVDYIAVPQSWFGVPCCPAVLDDFELLNKDHVPVQLDLSRQLIGPPPQGPRASQPFVKDPDSWPPEHVHQVRAELRRLPVIPWGESENVHVHTDKLFCAVKKVGAAARPANQRKCRPFIAESTKLLLDRSKHCRKWIKRLHGLKGALSRQSRGAAFSHEGWSSNDVDGMLAEACAAFQSIQTCLRNAVAEDKGRYAQQAHAKLLSAADPFAAKDFFRALRVLRPPGKKVLKPFSSLKVALAAEETHEDRVLAQQAHFAKLEAGVTCTPDALCKPSPPVAADARFDMADLPNLLELEGAVRAFRKGKAPGPEGIPDWVWALDATHSAKLLLPICLKTHLRLSEPISCKSTCLISLFKGKGSPSLVESHRAIALMSGPGKLIRKHLRPALIKAMQPSEFLQGGLPGSLLQGPHHFVRIHGALAKALKMSAAAIFIDVASAYYRVVRQAFEQGISSDAEVCQILDRLGVEPSSFHTVCQWLQGTHLVEGATPHQQRLLREFLTNTHFVMRGGTQLVQTFAGTRPGDSIADLLFALVQADFMNATRDRLREAGLLDDAISQMAFGEDKLLAPSWADDSVLLQCAATAEAQIDKTQRSLTLVHAEFLRRAMQPNYAPGKTEVVFSLRGVGAPAWRQRLLVRMGGLLPFRTHTGDLHVHCVRQYLHLGGYVLDRPAHLMDILRHMSMAHSAIKPLRRPVLRDARIPLKVRSMCLNSLAFSCASTTCATWGHLTGAEDKAWCRGFVRLARSLGRDDRWTGQPSLPDEKSVCRAFGLPSPRVYLRQQRLLHFQRLALTQPALLDLLLAEFHHAEMSWLSLLREDVLWAVGLQMMPAHVAEDFPLSLAAWSLHEPAAFRCSVRKAVRAWNQNAYEPAWLPVPALPSQEVVTPFSCEQCHRAFATCQQLAAHKFAVHGVKCDARRMAAGTTCCVCLTRYWTRERLVRHLHDSAQCLARMLEHELPEVQEVAPTAPELARLPATRLYGPLLPVTMPIAEVAASLAEHPPSADIWSSRWKSPAISRWVDVIQSSASEANCLGHLRALIDLMEHCTDFWMALHSAELSIDEQKA